MDQIKELTSVFREDMPEEIKEISIKLSKLLQMNQGLKEKKTIKVDHFTEYERNIGIKRLKIEG